MCLRGQKYFKVVVILFPCCFLNHLQGISAEEGGFAWEKQSCSPSFLSFRFQGFSENFPGTPNGSQ